MNNNPTLVTVISGSFRKHFCEITALKKALKEVGVAVLSPEGDTAVNPEDEFIILNSDPVNNQELLQSSIFAKIRKSTFLVVANINGYLGKAATLELGYALAVGIRVYTVTDVGDPNIAPFCQPLENVFPGILSNVSL